MAVSPEELERLKARVAERDPLLVEAANEVDRSLLTWFGSLSPLERLGTASRATRALHRFRRGRAP